MNPIKLNRPGRKTEDTTETILHTKKSAVEGLHYVFHRKGKILGGKGEARYDSKKRGKKCEKECKNFPRKGGRNKNKKGQRIPQHRPA